MVLTEIEYKRISELPLTLKTTLKTRLGDKFNAFLEVDSLVAISIANSVPHIQSIEPITGTFSEEIINLAGGVQQDVFKY